MVQEIIKVYQTGHLSGIEFSDLTVALGQSRGKGTGMPSPLQ
jgi:hypothetical protein